MLRQASWSLSLGRWGGVHVRLHMFFLLFAAFTLYLSWLDQQSSSAFGDLDGVSMSAVWLASVSLGVLLGSVLVHELAHYYTACRLGGDGDEIVIWPLGGLAPMRAPFDPQAEFVMHLAGPLVNLAVCCLAGGVLWAHPDGNLGGLLNPLAPQGLVEGSMWLCVAKLIFWINWVLLLVNLLPVFPFDGGRALRSGLAALSPDSNPQRAGFVVAFVAKIAAVALLVIAWLMYGDDTNRVIPVWFSLVLLAIFLYFSAKQEEERPEDFDLEEELFGYDFSQGFTSLERTEEGPKRDPKRAGLFVRWLEERRQAKLQREQEREAEEELRMDSILERLHADGMDALSDEERSILRRVSARYRERNSHES